MTAGRYRKRPVVIEAYRFDNRVTNQPPHWLHQALVAGNVWHQPDTDPNLVIRTLEGDMRANLGDWIIKGVAGEIYPCKPEIFAETYEAVE